MPTIPLTFVDTGRFVVNPNDLFITPEAVAEHSVRALQSITKIEPKSILDPGCGTGRWGEAVKKVWPDKKVTGVDLTQLDLANRALKKYDYYYMEDYLTYESKWPPHDLIIGNPPYSSATNKNLAEDFIWHSKKLLNKDGHLAFLLKTEYVASLQREKLFKEWPPMHIIQYVPRIKWDGHQFSNTIEYSFYTWKNDEERHRPLHWWLNWRSGELY